MLGLRLHNYEVVAQLGEGSTGTVWLALNACNGQQAAVKFLRPELMHDDGAMARFVNESRATNAIRHPNVVDIIDAGVLQCDGRTPYLMMEFLEGESLCQRLRRSRPLPVREAVDIACQIASALGAAHSLQIVHRDLKPENLYLLPDQSSAGCVFRSS
jgi:serine/threonine-protein kinase